MTPSQLKASRQALLLSQQELSEWLDVTNMTVSNWERGIYDIPKSVEYAMEYLWLLRNLGALKGPIAQIQTVLDGEL